MAWTNVAKPTGTPYTRVDPPGKEDYDEAITFDSATVFYDGRNTTAWTSVAKPSSSVWTKVAKPT